MMNIKPVAIAAFLLVPVSHIKADISAAEAQTGRTMEHIVVTATRTERNAADIMRSLNLIDRQQIESIQGQSLGDLVNALPNITLAGGPRAGNQTINIRGLGGNKLLQTIDGARLSFESGHRPSYFLDPALLKGVEALRGPASSLWGSGALGGVIAQRTLDPTDLTDGDGFGGFIRSGYNENNHQHTTTVAVSAESESVGWLLSGYHRKSDDLVLGDGDTLADSASQDAGVLAKVNWRLSDHQRLQFNYRASESDGSVPSNGTAEVNGTSNFLIDRKTQTQNANIRWDYDPGGNWLDSQVLVYWNQVDIDEARMSDGRADATSLDEYGLNLMNVSQVGNLTLQYGADIYRERFTAIRSGDNRPLPPEATTDVWSVYVQSKFQLADAWRVDAGLRYDDFTTQAENLNDQRSESSTSSSLALVWQPTDWADLALRYDEAFRAPTSEELYTSGTHFCMGRGFCNRFVPNGQLEAENASNVELLGRLRLTNVFGADRLTIEGAVFDNRVDNFIEQVVSGPSFFPFPDAGTTNWVNVSDANIQGFELQARYQRGGLNLMLGYGQTRGEDNATGDDLTNIPADTLSADLGYTFEKQSLVAGFRVIHAASQRNTDYLENTTGLSYDGYSVVDLYATWSPPQLPGVQFDFNINNVSDELYTRAWDQLPEAGREIILSARYSF